MDAGTDGMDARVVGRQYEHLCAAYLVQRGFSHVEVTPASGDYGVDVVAEKNGIRYAVQCKHYSKSVSGKAVQEVFTGMSHYQCDKAIVITNNTYTNEARELARENGVELWENVRLKYADKGNIKARNTKARNTKVKNIRVKNTCARRLRLRTMAKLVEFFVELAVMAVAIFILTRIPMAKEEIQSVASTEIIKTTEDAKSIETGESSVDPAGSEYILPESDSRYYTKSELRSLSKKKLRLARNEIYARHGRKFDSAELREYFEKQSWYDGTVEADDFKESSLNEFEKANIKKIMAVEEELK